MVKISNWKKFKLLLWKNWIIHWNRKVQLLLELISPVIFVCLLLFVRTLMEVEKKKGGCYEEIDIANLDILHKSMSQQLPLSYPAILKSLFKSLGPLYSTVRMPKIELAYSPNTMEIFQNIVKNAANRLLILNYHGYADAKKLEKALIINNYLAGVQFDSAMEYPTKLSFALRFPSELRTSSPKFAWTWFTMKLFPNRQTLGPRNPNASDGGVPVGYIREGFISLQHAISMAYLELASGKDKLPMVVMKRYPFREYIYDSFFQFLPWTMSIIILLSFIYPCTCITNSIATEKEKQLKEVMKIMGLRNWIHWTAWFVKSFLTLSISAIIITVMVKIKWTDNVAVLTYSDPIAILFFLLIYTIASICFCFMMATFFNKANTAVAVTGLVWFVAYIPFTFTNFIYDDLTLTDKLALSLFSNTAMGFAFKIILSLESTGEGLQWYNIFTPVTVDDNLSLGAIIIMMMISSILYMLICLYAEQIYPGEYGVPKKWNFPFTMAFWCGEGHVRANLKEKRKHALAGNNFETESHEKPIGIAVKNLKKTFGGKDAVRGLTMNIYEDEITVLLGHNGAGKTTVISMLIGMYPPTSGTANVDGYDIRKNLDLARESIGICPQHNVLFDDMSVADHIVFFSEVKGFKRKAARTEAQKYLRMIKLYDKAKVASSQLSGGMKRKLSICCALCGNSKIVICDEPSSGMDPSARRELWDLLQEEKQGRTVLLTTHFMDEADVLGDRIAILYEGVLKCYGTSFFLKKRYGSGYRLICTKGENCDVDKVTKLLRKYLPLISPESEIGTELSYKLPDSKISEFKEMFEALEERGQKLKLDGYGISITSMEEVFIKVSNDDEDIVEQRPTINKATSLEKKLVQFKKMSLPSLNVQKHQGVELFFNQWRAMILKKAYYTLRNKALLFVQNFMPIFFIATTILISRTRGSYNKLEPMTISLNQYPKSATVLQIDGHFKSKSLEHDIAKQYGKNVLSHGANHEFKSIGKQNFSQYILRLSETMQERIDSRYLAAATVKPGKIIAWLNNHAYHTAPLSLNLVHNAMARALIDPDAQITVINSPLPYKTETVLTQLDVGKNVGTQLAINLCFCMCFVSSFYLLFLIKERECRSKLLQFVGGVHAFTYWLTHFIWDMLTFTITAAIAIFTLLCFEEPGLMKFSEICRYFSILGIFGASVLPFTYLVSFYFTNSATGFACMSILCIFTGMALFLIVIVMSLPVFSLKDTADVMGWIFRIIPHFSLAMALNKLYINETIRRACSNTEEILDELRCKVLPRCCTIKPYYDWEEPGVLPEITYLLSTGVLCFTIILIREYKLIDSFIYIIRKRMIKPPPIKEYSNDDVYAEKLRIIEMSPSEIAEKNLVLDSVSKCYGNFFAVNQISLCVDRAECFGLIGVNGAGKTTTFKMLTGDERITFGDAYVIGMNIKSHMNRIYQEIGYCPQFDALLEDLTAYETLKIFCLIRGIPKQNIPQIAREFALSFGFSKHYRKQIKALSGGNKRKLSAAIAFVGNPSIVYLDEPTTSMDPATRRQLWDVICSRRDAGNSVVMTSHSMDECEALCTRLAIMVNGEFECIGSTQYLKNRFSQGIILKIKVNPNTLLRKEVSLMKFNSLERKRSELKLIDNTNIKTVKEFVKHEFPSAILQEEYRFILTFYVPLATIKWSQIFGLMENNRQRLNIEDYSISQTSLEEIFLAFAKFQKDDPRRSSIHTRPGFRSKLNKFCFS